MDYKEKVIDLLNSKELSQDRKEKLKSIFPELAESEDETIRKELLAVIDDLILPDEQKERFVAWLEKQGEKAKYHDICDKCVRQPTCQSDCFLQQGEQKPAWSEEDCNQIESIACHLDNIGNGAMAESLLNIMDKYKSYRPQSHWKPSIKQMEAIQDAIEFLGCTKNVREDLKSLYEQLKKLKEE